MSLTFLQRKPDSGLGNIRSSPGDPSRNVDWALLLTQGALTVIGCAIVFSASRTRLDDDPYAFVTRQVIFAIVASVVMFAVMSVDYEWLKDRARFFYGLTLVVLALLFIIGQVSGKDRISFDFGPFNFQPAELAKFTTLLVLAAYLADERSDEVSYPRFLGGLLLVGTPTVLVMLQPDLGSASVLISMAMGVLLVAGAKPKYIALISVLSLATLMAAFVGRFVNQYQIERLRVFLDQDTSNPDLQDAVYQVRNAVRAVGTGGVWGKGWLEGPLTNGRDIPVMWADFPFAAIGEQFGLVGCAVVLGLFVIALMRIWRIAHLSRDLLGTYLCAGVFTMLLWQVFQNVGMTLGIMPVTGLPMPFISYGGSSLITYFALFGIVQSVHMRRMR
jgi:rod shape determining protein RodA